ncbi:baseplate J/gp47 family protein [Desulforamulus aquiferis]|uniref:Baseplate J/gp47 family protein n=1 Tax=Desulforamulus aquiferis TaxID=1397668 RepID=A0AAW7ZCR5_9FIRM|nr:baseplate J/gp47 family protein [Desulforamulus aquiferis]MDO7787117.1 baseplate J/gp47 family protein [Desulforamulus aquiferis]
MFEDQTFDAIMRRMLARVPENQDKREGSIIWDALAPAALELSEAYIILDIERQQTFAEDARGEMLDKRVADRGITRLLASRAIREAAFNISIEVNERFFLDGLYFKVIEPGYLAKVECETAGTIGNTQLEGSELLPVSTISGLTSAVLGPVLVLGTDVETDEALRKRYFNEVKNQAIDGNIAQYQKWAREYPGIGRAKIFPLWAGVNTVKISILDAENKVASAGLIADFQQYMDPNSEGLGNGVAPVGSKVTITTATSVDININAEVVLAEGYTEASAVDEALTTYLKELAYKKNTVSYISIGAAILNVPAVDQVRDLLVNGAATDITLTSEQIPKLSTTTWTVIA